MHNVTGTTPPSNLGAESDLNDAIFQEPENFNAVPQYSFDVFVNAKDVESKGAHLFRMATMTAKIKGKQFKVSVLATQEPCEIPVKGDVVDLVFYPMNVENPNAKARVIRCTLDSDAEPDAEINGNAMRGFGGAFANPACFDLTYSIISKSTFVAPLSNYSARIED